MDLSPLTWNQIQIEENLIIHFVMVDLNKSSSLFFTISINETSVGRGNVLVKSSARDWNIENLGFDQSKALEPLQEIALSPALNKRRQKSIKRR